MRQRFYQFHFADVKKHSARTERIFEMGHLFEQIAIAELKRIGCEVFKVIDGKEVELFGLKDEDQEEFVDQTGHALGHPDGRIRGLVERPTINHLLELKTMAASYFEDVKKRGVKRAHPYYYGQTQRYMKASDLKWTCFLAINKNTSQYHFEFIEYNENEARDYVRREVEVLVSDAPLEQGYKKGHYRCGKEWCDFEDVCWNGKEANKNCRTCEHSDLENGGKWVCTVKRKQKTLTLKRQRIGCEKHKIGWGLK